MECPQVRDAGGEGKQYRRAAFQRKSPACFEAGLFDFDRLHARRSDSLPASGQVTHFNISCISGRAGLLFAADLLSILTLGPHPFVIQLEQQPDTRCPISMGT